MAPFDAAQAKQFQKAWADSLHVPVVREVELGGATMKLTLIPPGTFQMGSPEGEAGREKNEGPQHEVTITRPFYLGVYPVTMDDFQAFVQEAGYKTEAEKDGTGAYGWNGKEWKVDPKFNWRNPGRKPDDNEPVTCVSWNDAVAFCQWLGKKEGRAYRLPTEAEWEYACRAGTRTAYSFGDDPKNLGDYAWYIDNSGSRAHPAGGKRPNGWGLYDMQGNVFQWCQDYYDAYSDHEEINPIKTLKEAIDARALRGGSWGSSAVDCRAAARSWIAPGSRYNGRGLRVCFRLD